MEELWSWRFDPLLGPKARKSRRSDPHEGTEKHLLLLWQGQNCHGTIGLRVEMGAENRAGAALGLVFSLWRAYSGAGGSLYRKSVA